MHYFNYAGLSPARPEAVDELQAVSNEFRTLLFSESGIAWYRKQEEQCRKRVGRLLHFKVRDDGNHVVFVPNATTAFKVILSVLGLQRGDIVITSDQEHPSTVRALSFLRHRGVEVKIIPARSEEEFLARLACACKERRVRLIALSHVAHTDGRILPLQQVCEIARTREVILAIDGAQAVGHVPVNLGALDADLYFFSGHKWCAGPMGTGGLLITERFIKRNARIESDLSGRSSAHDYFDLGTQNIGLISGFAKACEIRQQELPAMANLAGRRILLRERLGKTRDLQIVEWDGPHAPGILSFQVNKAGFDTTRIADYLNIKYDIAIKPLRYPESPQTLRVSWSLSTEVQDILFLAEKLDEALEFFGQHGQ